MPVVEYKGKKYELMDGVTLEDLPRIVGGGNEWAGVIPGHSTPATGLPPGVQRTSEFLKNQPPPIGTPTPLIRPDPNAAKNMSPAEIEDLKRKLFIPPAVQQQRERERMGILQRELMMTPNDPALQKEIEFQRRSMR